MSGAARRRGRGRANVGDGSSQSSSHRGSRGSRGSRGRGDQVPAGGFDGPASRGSASGTGTSHGRRPSNAPSLGSGSGSPTAPQGAFAPPTSQPGSRRSSQSGGAPPSTSAKPIPVAGGDPAREQPTRYTDQLRNIDLPASFYNIDNLFSLPTEFKKRPGFNNSGKAIMLQLNAYTVTQFPNVKIYQYDVTIGNGAEPRAVQRKVWNSQARKNATGNSIIWDGNKLAWSLVDYPELRVMVDLDAEEGRPSRGGPNSFRLHIVRTKILDVSIINQYLEGRIQMGFPVLEAISFLDHLLREGPTLDPRFITVKRSLFTRDGSRLDLGGHVEVYRGIYQSMRLAEGKKLIVNLDVANSCFWKPGALTSALLVNVPFRDVQDMGIQLRNGERRKAVSSRIKGTTVKVVYVGNKAPAREWKIARIDENNAHNEKIEWRGVSGREATGQMVSVADYFLRRYNLRLQYPQLQLVEVTKRKAKFPMEFLNIIPHQRYGTKLNETQTANMIRFAVSPPATRLAAINEGKGWLNWANDPYLTRYGLQIDQNTVKTQARLLPSPGVKFGNTVNQSGTSGRWDLKGKKFLSPNPTELASWGVGFFTNGRQKLDLPAVQSFVKNFSQAYRNHGGRVSQTPPVVMALPDDAGEAALVLHTAAGNRFQVRPQLLVFLVQDKQAFHYLRIKKSCDCRFGVVSQVMQMAQVAKGSPQYFSNVLMKVNAKLGGCTSQSMPHASSGFKSFGGPTMFIGADVSHASPGSLQSSMAALTVSFDTHAGRYCAACQTNGHRVEMISDANMRSMLGPLISQWTNEVPKNKGTLPSQVYYMRDGVSEGQFAHVMQQEVPCIRAILTKVNGGNIWSGKLTVVIASKRHHIRAFPKPGDRSAGDPKDNPLPGCLIERDVTTPFEWDFYLYSHIALQGTARPVHYTILHDDANHPPSVIQNMIYEHCYQYMRSTTSVSLHPAVYYAHLASNRAKAHEDTPASEGPTAGPGFKSGSRSHSSDPPNSESRPLIPMLPNYGIKSTMWYI